MGNSTYFIQHTSNPFFFSFVYVPMNRSCQICTNLTFICSAVQNLSSPSTQTVIAMFTAGILDCCRDFLHKVRMKAKNVPFFLDFEF